MMFPKPTKKAKTRVKTIKASLHLLSVKLLPCAICGSSSPNDAHHCRSDSFGGKRASDFATIPLCKICHMIGKLSFHGDKNGWEERNGKDWEYIPDVLAQLGISTDTDF